MFRCRAWSCLVQRSPDDRIHRDSFVATANASDASIQHAMLEAAYAENICAPFSRHRSYMRSVPNFARAFPAERLLQRTVRRDCVEVKLPERFVSLDEQFDLATPALLTTMSGPRPKWTRNCRKLRSLTLLLQVTFSANASVPIRWQLSFATAFTSSSVRAATATPRPQPQRRALSRDHASAASGMKASLLRASFYDYEC